MEVRKVLSGDPSLPSTLVCLCFLVGLRLEEPRPPAHSPKGPREQHETLREQELAKLSDAKGSSPPEMKVGSLGLSSAGESVQEMRF